MKVITTVVGELGTNCYLLIDEATREAALIDPADSPDELSALIEREGVTLRYILAHPRPSRPHARRTRHAQALSRGRGLYPPS